MPTLGQQQYFNCWNLSDGPMLGQWQHANNDMLPTTPTITQRWPNDRLLAFWDKPFGWIRMNWNGNEFATTHFQPFLYVEPDANTTLHFQRWLISKYFNFRNATKY